MQSASNTNLQRGNPSWIKGKSANPAGRPKGEPMLTPELRRQLTQICPMDPQKRPWIVVLVERTMGAACKGNPAAIKEVWERLDGKVKEQIQVDINLGRIKMMTDEELEQEARAVIDITPEPQEQLGNGSATEAAAQETQDQQTGATA